MRSIRSWYPASSPRSSLAWSDNLRTVFLTPCNGSSSRRSRPFSRFSRRVSRFREPTSPRSALIVSFCFRVRSSALRSRALARSGEACAARFDLRSAATFLRNATSSSFCSCERSSALRSRAFSLDSGPVVPFPAAGAGAALSGLTFIPDEGAVASFRACDACKASRNRKTSMRSDMIVPRLLESTPACERSFSSRATSAWKNSAFFAARRTPFTSSTAALSLSRLLSSCHFSEPARERAAVSARRSSSARACACSYRDCQSRDPRAGAAIGGDQCPSSASTGVRAAPKSSSRIAMCETIANRGRRYQCLV